MDSNDVKDFFRLVFSALLLGFAALIICNSLSSCSVVAPGERGVRVSIVEK
jgi:hypothetical protein